MALAYAVSLRNTRLDAIAAAIGNGGLVRLYDGSRPATGGTATTKLAELTGGSPFAPGSSGGVLTAGAIAQDASADASGTATWGRVVTSGGTFVADFSVGTSGSDLNLTTNVIVAGQPVSISGFAVTEGNP